MYLQKINIKHLLVTIALLLLVACSSSDKKTSNTVLSISSPAYGSITTLDKISLTGTVSSEQPVKSLNYVLNSAQFIDITNQLQNSIFNVEIVGLKEGENLIELKAIDSEGNSSSTQVKFFRDSSKPLINITSHQDGEVIEAKQQTIKGQVQDSGDQPIKQFFVDLNGTQQDIFQNLQEDGTFSLEFTSLKQGTNKIIFTAVDEADNQGITSLELNFPAGSIAALLLPITTTPNPNLRSLAIPAGAHLVTGQAIVKFKEDSTEKAKSSLETQGLSIENYLGLGLNLVSTSANLSTQNFSTAKADSEEAQSTLELIANLKARDDVLYAEPNYIYQLMAVEPNDPLYDQQWNHPIINLPEAWEITKGSSDVVVAVLDSGITSNQDFNCDRSIMGLDFIQGDTDPTDDDNIQHGSHVAGIIGACSDNAHGVAGVDWSAKLLHVRICNNQGCPLNNQLLALQWATGLLNGNGVFPDNSTPADIINMSLGGPGLSQSLQDVITTLVKLDKIVVVAAGNDSNRAELYGPAGLEGVITVGATNRANDIAAYSNHGSSLEIMAPGGQTSLGFDENGGVLSTVKDDFAYFQGTSMASPHIAGVVALMKAVNPELNWAKATHYLQSTAAPIETSLCQQHGCGTGLVDARAAVQAALDNQSIGPILRLSSISQLNIPNLNQVVTLSNDGDQESQVNLSIDVPYVTVDPQQVTVGPGEDVNIKLFFKISLVPGNGFYQAKLTLNDSVKNRQIPVFANLGTPTISGTIPLIDLGPLDWEFGLVNGNGLEPIRGSLVAGSGDEAVNYNEGYVLFIEDVMAASNYGLLAKTTNPNVQLSGIGLLEVETGKLTTLVISLHPDFLVP